MDGVVLPNDVLGCVRSLVLGLVLAHLARVLRLRRQDLFGNRARVRVTSTASIIKVCIFVGDYFQEVPAGLAGLRELLLPCFGLVAEAVELVRRETAYSLSHGLPHNFSTQICLVLGTSMHHALTILLKA